MKNLKVVESGLIPVYEDKESRMLVNAREMHGYLESGWQFTDWVKNRIDKYGFIEGEDYTSFQEILKRGSGGGTTRTEYLFTVDTAKEIAMVENNDKGREVRRYFIACEKRLKGSTNPVSEKDTERLKQQARRLDIMDRNSRNQQAQILKSVANDFRDLLSAESIQSIASHVTMLIAGEALVALPETERTYSATEVGEMCGISANMVGKIANAHNLKTEEFGVFVLDKARGHNKQFPNFRYNQKGVDRIKELVTEGVVVRVADLEAVEA